MHATDLTTVNRIRGPPRDWKLDVPRPPPIYGFFERHEQLYSREMFPVELPSYNTKWPWFPMYYNDARGHETFELSDIDPESDERPFPMWRYE